MYIVNGQEFTSASKAVDYVANNTDFHYLCEKGISNECYRHVVWAIRNMAYERVARLTFGEKTEFEYVIIERVN